MQPANYKIEEVVEKAENLSYLPTIVLKLMEIISSPDITVQEIVEVIKKDQGLVARVFKVANSSFYGRLKKAENLTDAVVTMGLRGLKSFVITQAVKHVLTTASMDDHSLWEHAVKVSLAAIVLANELRCDALDDAMVGGLVHDIGKAFIISVYPDAPSLIQQKVMKDGVTYAEAEQIVLGFDHANVGALITEKWNFPPKIIDMIRYHHSSDDIKELGAESLDVVRIIKFANVISNQYDSLSTDTITDDMLEELGAMSAFNLPTDRLTHVIEEIKNKWLTEGENNLFC